MLAKFTNRQLANSFSQRTIKASVVMLGDDGKFWVVNLATMKAMLKSGYELAK
jgi:hypothetical protein